MKKIIATIHLVVYDDGSIEVKQQPISKKTEETSSNQEQEKITQRIQQIMAVIKEVVDLVIELEETWSNLTLDTVNPLVTIAFKNVATKFRIEVLTVSDKATRQLGLNKKEFSRLLLKFLQGDMNAYKSSELFQHLQTYTQKQPYDRKYMENCFSEICENIK